MNETATGGLNMQDKAGTGGKLPLAPSVWVVCKDQGAYDRTPRFGVGRVDTVAKQTANLIREVFYKRRFHHTELAVCADEAAANALAGHLNAAVKTYTDTERAAMSAMRSTIAGLWP